MIFLEGLLAGLISFAIAWAVVSHTGIHPLWGIPVFLVSGIIIDDIFKRTDA